MEHEHPTLIRQIIQLHHEQHFYDVESSAALTGLRVGEYLERFNDHPDTGLRIVRA